MAKHVFSNMKELSHAWAHQSVSYGSSGSVRFDGADFYSYGTIIARRLVHKGRPVFVYDHQSFSNSTSKHQNTAFRAGFGMKISINMKDERRRRLGYGSRGSEFPVNTVRDATDILWNQYKTEGEKSRYKHMNAYRYLIRVARLKQAIDICSKLGLGHKKLSAELDKIQPLIEEAAAIRAEWEIKLNARREAERARNRMLYAVEIEHHKKDILQMLEGDLTVLETIPEIFGWGTRGQAFRDLMEERPDLRQRLDAEIARRSELTVADWMAGARGVAIPYSHPIVMRVVDDGKHIETSRHAKIPYAEGLKLFRFAMAKRGTGWKRNGETFRVGNFQLDEVNTEGIVAGCHNIKWDAIEDLARREGVLK